jgi:DNA-binding winged helix-turn-helix (wHTH) protein/tetratricopeptide (TPR) repeat protein
LKDEATYSFGPFALDAGHRVLRHEGTPLRLTPKEVDVLIALVVRHGEIVDKGQLLDQVWPGVCVEECNLSQHVAALRRILGDDVHHPAYIETVPRRGYRFVAPVARESGPSSAARTPAPDRARLSATPAPRPTPLPAAGVPTPAPGAPFPGPLPPSPAQGVRRRQMTRSVPLAFLVLAALGMVVWWSFIGAEGPSPTPAIRSVAVLPVTNMTGDEHNDDLAETLTASMMADLRALKGLRVEAAHAPTRIGHTVTGVDAIVETSLLGGGGRVMIVAEILDARTNRLVWAEVLDSEAVSSIEAEKRVVQAMASRLLSASRPGDRDRSSSGRADARREYLLARTYLSRRTPQVVVEAIEHFTSAAELDPDFAPALAGLASAYLLGAEQRALEPVDTLARAEAAARRALEIAPSAEAHAAIGAISAARWDFASAEASYRRALALDPSIAVVHERYAALLTVLDRHEEAIAQARVARDLSPSCPAAATALAAAYLHAGRNGEASEKALAALRLSPGFAAAYDVLGWAHQAEGREAEALGAFGEAVRLSERNPAYVAALAGAHARVGARDEARRLLAELQRGQRNRSPSPLDLAEVLVALGDGEGALEQVERAGAEGTPWLQRADAGLGLVSLHEHARFRVLAERLRQASASTAARAQRSASEAREPAAGGDR